MAKPCESEEALFKWIVDLSGTHDAVDVEETFVNIKKFGVEHLVAMCKEGLRDTKKDKLLSNRVFSSLYTAVCLACTRGGAEGSLDTTAPADSEERNTKMLYKKHSQEITDYLTSYVRPDLDKYHERFLLQQFEKHWEQHKIFTEWMRRCFMYLDRRGPIRHEGAHQDDASTTSASLQLFKVEVFDAKKGDIMDTIQELIDREREGEAVDKSLLKSVIELFIVMGVTTSRRDFKNMAQAVAFSQRAEAASQGNSTYINDFQTPFLERTRQFYRRRADAWISEDSTPIYLKKAEEALASESGRVGAYLNPVTQPHLIKTVEQELLTAHMTRLLEKEGSGLKVLLRDNKLDDIARMYRLFNRVGGVEAMAKVVEEHIQLAGMAIVGRREAREAKAGSDGKKKKSDANDPDYVNDMVKLHADTKSLVHEQLGQDTQMQRAHGRAFRSIMCTEKGSHSNAEILSAYCDYMLKKGRKMSPAEIEKQLDQVVQLFDYLQDQDLFAELYRGQLAKRLLGKKSASQDAENAFVSKLKLRCGAQFTLKMEGMFTDLNLGSTAQAEYSREWAKELAKEAGSGGARDAGAPQDFSVKVLKAGYWPTFVNVTCALPVQLERCRAHFEAYYLELESKRRLQWVHSQGTVVLRCTFDGGAWKSLNVSTLQAVVLLLFNKQESYTFEQIVAALAMGEGHGDDTAKRILHPLYTVKGMGILAKKPPGKVSPDDKFTFNNRVKKHPKKVLSFPAPPLAPSQAKKRVEQDRRFVIDASVVRVMKARRKLKHAELMSEVFRQLQYFRPTGKQVKERIEDLISREYLERTEGGSNEYQYLA